VPTLSGFAHLRIAGTIFAIIGTIPANCDAQGKLDARYTASLAGIPIGRGAWVIDVGDDQYTAAASGVTAGILSAFASGKGNGASRGHVRSDGLSPNTYASSITSDNKTEEMRVALNNGNVKDATITPPTPFNPERLPLTEANKRGVIDPVSGVLMLPPGSGNPLSPEACRRTIPMFDGRMRFDLHMTFRRMDTVRAVKGYQGPAVVCLVQFQPVAGYVPDRPAIKYLVAQQNIEVYLAPLMGTRILVPFKLTVPTPLGQGVIEATQFVTTPTPRLTANSPTH
jgi:Protein of unknown function (DUF3108)